MSLYIQDRTKRVPDDWARLAGGAIWRSAIKYIMNRLIEGDRLVLDRGRNLVVKRAETIEGNELFTIHVVGVDNCDEIRFAMNRRTNRKKYIRINNGQWYPGMI